MNDDELRQRLHAMPEPTTTIDVDAVVADARRRRRPKVIGAGAAVGAACLAFLAPVVVPGLLGPDPVTSTLQEAGVAEQDDSGGEPAAPASDGTDADEPDASTLQSDGVDVAGPPPTGCTATPVEQVQSGLSISFATAPVDGEGTLVLSNDGVDAITVRIGSVGEAYVDVGGTVLAAASIAQDAVAGPLLVLEPGQSEQLAVEVLPAAGCDDLSPVEPTAAAGALVPVVDLAIGTAGATQAAVLGESPLP